MSKWYRKQSFYQSPSNEKVRWVQFYCRRYDKIKAVEVVLREAEALQVKIYPTHTGDKVLRTKASTLPEEKVRVSKSGYFYDLNEYSVYLNPNKNSLNIIIELLKLLGDSEEVINEINNIHQFVYAYDNSKLYKHIIEVHQINSPKYNFEKSMELQKIFLRPGLFSTQAEEVTKKMDDLLMSGANPNIEMGSGLTLLSFIFFYYEKHLEEQIIIKLLVLGADPFLYNEYIMQCPYYVALNRGKYHILKLFDEVGVRKSKGMATLKIQDDIYRHGNAIMTRFKLPDGRIYKTCLKKNIDLTPEEKRSFIEMYKTHFPKNGNTQAAEQAAIEDIDGPHTLVEAIRYENVLVGMNIFRKLFQEARVISFEISICVLNPEHRNNPLVPLLAYRIPCALQLIFPEDDVYVMQSMINWISFYRLYKDILNTSKYYSHILNIVLLHSLNVSLDGKYHAVQKGMTYYITDQVQINNPARPLSEQSLYERFFYEVLLALPAGAASTQGRSHPGLCVIGDQFVSRLLELTIGINFYKHIIELAKCMDGKDISLESLRALNKNTHTLFHTGQREVGSLNLPVARL